MQWLKYFDDEWICTTRNSNNEWLLLCKCLSHVLPRYRLNKENLSVNIYSIIYSVSICLRQCGHSARPTGFAGLVKKNRHGRGQEGSSVLIFLSSATGNESSPFFSAPKSTFLHGYAKESVYTLAICFIFEVARNLFMSRGGYTFY